MQTISHYFYANKEITPKYRRLSRTIKNWIENEKVAPGEALPSERDLADELQLSRVTVRKAIEDLMKRGLIDKRHGSGTFVSKRIEKSVSSVSSFTEDMQHNHITPSSRLIDFQTHTANPKLALIFHLSQHEEVVTIQRVRLANEAPIAYEIVVVPAHTLPNQYKLGASLYEDMQKMQSRPVRSIQRIRAIEANTLQARLLETSPGSACLHIERHGVLNNGRVVEYTNSYYRSDAYEFVTETKTDNNISIMGTNYSNKIV